MDENVKNKQIYLIVFISLPKSMDYEMRINTWINQHFNKNFILMGSENKNFRFKGKGKSKSG